MIGGIPARPIQAKAEIHSWEDCHRFYEEHGNGLLWNGYNLERSKCQLGKNTPNLSMVKMLPHGNGQMPHRYHGTSDDTECEYCTELKGNNRMSYGIVLYDTIILAYHCSGMFLARNGGFNTLTTTSRLNQFGPEGWFFFHKNKKLWVRKPCGMEVDTTKANYFKI